MGIEPTVTGVSPTTTGFEDRGTHQDPTASGNGCTGPPAARQAVGLRSKATRIAWSTSWAVW